MRSTSTFVLLIAIVLAVPAAAQDGIHKPNPSQPAAAKTGKERLGKKWTDEQRIDNCNVPIDKRGTKPRSAVCLHAPTS